MYIFVLFFFAYLYSSSKYNFRAFALALILFSNLKLLTQKSSKNNLIN